MAAPKLRFKEFGGDWSKKRLDSFLERTSSPVNVIDTQNYVQIGIRSHGKGIFHKESVTGKELGNKRVFWVVPNALVVNIVFAWERAIAVTSDKENGLIASHRFPMYLPKDGLSDVNFLRYMFITDKGQSYLELASPGGAGRNKTLGQSNFAELKIDLPIVEEQTKIASFLSNVDEKISQLTQKHALLSQYKQGMMQKLFSQEIRFKADDGSEFGEWETLKFKYFIQERNQICSDATVELCSLTIEKGVTEKTERYTRDFLVKDEKNAYKEVHFNDFVMNPMNLRFGAIAKSNMDKIVKISKYYNVFNINQNIVNLDYFVYFSVSKPIIDFYNLMSTGSLIEKRRNHFKDFIQYEKSFPCLEEQTKIANFLSAINQKIEVVAQQIEQAKIWKKGLLQQMFV